MEYVKIQLTTKRIQMVKEIGSFGMVMNELIEMVLTDEALKSILINRIEEFKMTRGQKSVLQ